MIYNLYARISFYIGRGAYLIAAVRHPSPRGATDIRSVTPCAICVIEFGKHSDALTIKWFDNVTTWDQKILFHIKINYSISIKFSNKF